MNLHFFLKQVSSDMPVRKKSGKGNNKKTVYLIVMKDLIGAIISLYLMIQNSVVKDTTHGLIFLLFETASQKKRKLIGDTKKQADKATSQVLSQPWITSNRHGTIIFICDKRSVWLSQMIE